MNNRVSIIIPMYNPGPLIRRSILSALKQTYDNTEIIVVDDGSTDDSLKVARKIAEKDKRVKVYHKENGGVSSARNYGIRKATGEYLLFVDADDEIGEEVVSNLVMNYSKNTLVSCGMAIESKKSTTILKRKRNYSKNDAIQKIINNELQGYICGYLFEKTKCPMFNEAITYCEDMLFLIQYILDNGVDVLKYVDSKEGFYIYHHEENGVTRDVRKITKSIVSIDKAMKALDLLTDHLYSNDINDKKIQLYEYELSRANKDIIANVLSTARGLDRYHGRSIRYRLFAKLYSKKRAHLLLLYFAAKKMTKIIAMKEG